MKQIALLAALLAALPLGGTAGAATATTVAAQPGARSAERQVDTLFAKWTRPGMPGAVVGVIRDGKVVLSKAYEIGRASCRERV